MITRLKISGFKNLVDVDVRFGPFTCIAGLNGVGKSNLFDAIRFLSSTASMTLADAASRVRDEGGRPSEIRDLFSRDALNQHGLMRFEVEMITPVRATDDLGADARATANFLVYRLDLKHRLNGTNGLKQEGIEIVKEELEHIQKSQAASHLPFAREAREWRNSLLTISHRTAPFISTATEEGKVIIRMHQDGGSSGRPKTLAAGTPRTVLSIANASESPTALCARRERESWMLLQLAPSSLREPDHVNAPHMLSQEGEHLPATLHALAQRAKKPGMSAKEAKAAEDRVYATIWLLGQRTFFSALNKDINPFKRVKKDSEIGKLLGLDRSSFVGLHQPLPVGTSTKGKTHSLEVQIPILRRFNGVKRLT